MWRAACRIKRLVVWWWAGLFVAGLVCVPCDRLLIPGGTFACCRHVLLLLDYGQAVGSECPTAFQASLLRDVFCVCVR